MPKPAVKSPIHVAEIRGRRSTVTGPPTFAEGSDEEHVKQLADIIPYRWRHGGRDSVESFGKLLGATRDHKLYRKVGCESWEAYCHKFLEDSPEAIDKLIECVKILNRPDEPAAP